MSAITVVTRREVQLTSPPESASAAVVCDFVCVRAHSARPTCICGCQGLLLFLCSISRVCSFSWSSQVKNHLLWYMLLVTWAVQCVKLSHVMKY